MSIELEEAVRREGMRVAVDGVIKQFSTNQQATRDTPDVEIEPEEEGQVKEAIHFYLANSPDHWSINPQAVKRMKLALQWNGVPSERADIIASNAVERLDASLDAIVQRLRAR